MEVHITMVATIIMAATIETPTAEEITIADSETKVVVTKTTKEAKTIMDSEIRTIVLRELSTTKTAVDPEAKTADLEVLKAAATAPADQNLPIAVGLEIAQAPKAAVLVTQADRTAVAEALDKTIINKETNS